MIFILGIFSFFFFLFIQNCIHTSNESMFELFFFFKELITINISFLSGIEYLDFVFCFMMIRFTYRHDEKMYIIALLSFRIFFCVHGKTLVQPLFEYYFFFIILHLNHIFSYSIIIIIIKYISR